MRQGRDRYFHNRKKNNSYVKLILFRYQSFIDIRTTTKEDTTITYDSHIIKYRPNRNDYNNKVNQEKKMTLLKLTDLHFSIDQEELRVNI